MEKPVKTLIVAIAGLTVVVSTATLGFAHPPHDSKSHPHADHVHPPVRGSQKTSGPAIPSRRAKRLPTTQSKPKTSGRSSVKSRKSPAQYGKIEHVNRSGKPFKVKLPANLDLKKIGTSRASSYTYYLRNLSEVTGYVDAIIVGRPTLTFTSRDHYATFSTIGSTESILDAACSIGPFQVEQVLYQKTGVGLSSGQTVSVAETAAIVPNDGVYTRVVVESCTELKHNSRYVLFVLKSSFTGYPVLYTTCNLELGRFNVDGTDYDDESGGRAGKEALRRELTAAYGVTFAVPTTVAPSISSLSPSSAVPGGAAFTLTVNGGDFKNGAVIKFGNTEKVTTFLSATQLSAPILASEIGAQRSVSVTVTNPDSQMSGSSAFTIGAATPSPAVMGLTWRRIIKGELQGTILLKNEGTVAITGYQITQAWLAPASPRVKYGTTTRPLPSITTIAPGDTKTIVLAFPGSIPAGPNCFFCLRATYNGAAHDPNIATTIP